MGVKEKSIGVVEFFKDLVGMMDIPAYYKRYEDDFEREEFEEELAIKFGFFDDDYYTAKEKMDIENKFFMSSHTGAHGSFSCFTRC